MTFVGHSLIGASVAALVVPTRWPKRRKAVLVVGFALLANLPDLRLPYWGHGRYEISHSLFVTLGLFGAASLFLLLPGCRRLRPTPPIWLGACLAWLSHLLLDTFYSHGRGLAMFWPFGNARMALPLPWFERLRQPLPHLDGHAVRVFTVELVAYGLVCALAGSARWAWSRATGNPCRPVPSART